MLGPFTDATVLPRGVLRVGIEPTWWHATHRFSGGLAGRPEGSREPLGADFDRDSITPAMFEPLRAVAGTLAAITGNNALPLTLGRLQVDFDASAVHTPITFEYGVSRRLTLGVMVPYISTRNEVYANPNPSRTGGTMGVNPALTFAGARAQNAGVVSQLAAAATALRGQLAACAGSSDPACAAINADRAGAEQLAGSAEAVAQGIASVYGTQAGEGSRFSPVAGSPVQLAVAGRLAALATSFGGYLGSPTAGTSWIDARPVGAAPLALGDFQTIVADETFGIAALPFSTVEIKKIGDVELGAKLLLLDSFGGAVPQRIDPAGVKYRLSLGGVYRMGTGQLESADDLNDIGTGDAQNDIEGSLFADLLFGSRVWVSAVARYGVQQADVQPRRIPSAPGEPFPSLYRRHTVTRDLGDYIAAEVTPRYAVTDALLVSASYRYYSKPEDAHSGTFQGQDLEGNDVTIDASLLDAGTARTEQRLLGALTYSTMAAYYRGGASIPLEVSYTLGRTTAGSGNVPQSITHAIALRVYARLFGGAESRPARPRSR